MIRALPAALLLALCGCSLAPKEVASPLPVPDSWPRGDAYLAQREADLPAVSYRDIFTDARLQALIAQAQANNRDLRQAAASLAQARAQVRVTRAAQFPEVTASGSAIYNERAGNAVGAEGWTYSLQGGVASFELDLFGRLANATAAERATALASEASARTVRLGVIADLALAWAAYGADRDLLRIAEATAANAESSLRLTAARLAGGIAPRTDVRQAEQVLETARGDVALQKTALAQDVNAIRLLLGAEVDPALLPGGIAEVNAGLAVLPAGTSSQVLLRRPDVLAAEYQLRAANADIGVARARLFPTISLTGLLGLASGSLSGLFDGGAFTASAGGGADWSLFNAGGRAAGVDVAEARRDGALAAYERTIQVAFREVADALADQGTLAERQRAAAAVTEAARDTARLTEATYRQGIASSLDNLDAQRSLYAARRAEVATRLQAAANRVALYRTLGGDRAAALTD